MYVIITSSVFQYVIHGLLHITFPSIVLILPNDNHIIHLY